MKLILEYNFRLYGWEYMSQYSRKEVSNLNKVIFCFGCLPNFGKTRNPTLPQYTRSEHIFTIIRLDQKFN